MNLKKEIDKIFSDVNLTRDIPVDLNLLCKKYDIDLIETSELEDNISGLLYFKNNKFKILVNQNHSSLRKRFTIAHELGHFFLHREERFLNILEESEKNNKPELAFFRDKNSSLGLDSKEIEANKFAAELLIPSEEFSKHNNEEDSKLAERFQVSKTSIHWKRVNSK